MVMSALTTTKVTNELNTRGYFQEVPTSTPVTVPVSPPSTIPASKPTISYASYLKYSIDAALQSYGYALSPTSVKYIPKSNWDALINTAINISSQFDNQYTVLTGTNGLRGLRGLGRLGADTTSVSWGSQWGPIILQMIGSAATIGGQYWQNQITRDQLQQQYQSTTGQALGIPTSQDKDAIAVQLQKMGYSTAEINSILNKAIPDTQDKDSMPSWLLPAGVGLVALMLIQNRK